MDENGPAARLVLGGSAIRRRIVALLIGEPGVRLHLREITRRVGTSPGTASRELGRLTSAGLVDREAEGNQVYFRMASTPNAAALRTILVPVDANSASVAATPDSIEASTIEASTSRRSPTLRAPSIPGADDSAPRSPRTIHAPAPRQHRPDALGLKVAATLAEILRPLYAGRLIGVYLYGARARGDAQPDSDIEIAVVLDQIVHYGEELERTSLTFAGMTLEHGVLVSRLFIPEAVWKGRANGRLPAIRLEAVAV